ncbi:hypothetical protein GCM10009624_22690 [Gordonia sinesedis]
MFSSVGWGEILILLAAGLIILGPERLPGAVSWSMQSLRKARDYATGATDQLKNELGPEFDELRTPLSQLNELRGMSPQSLITKHLLDGDDSLFTTGPDGALDRSSPAAPPIKPVSSTLPTGDGAADTGDRSTVSLDKPSGERPASATPVARKHDVTDWDAT